FLQSLEEVDGTSVVALGSSLADFAERGAIVNRQNLVSALQQCLPLKRAHLNELSLQVREEFGVNDISEPQQPSVIDEGLVVEATTLAPALHCLYVSLPSAFALQPYALAQIEHLVAAFTGEAVRTKVQLTIKDDGTANTLTDIHAQEASWLRMCIE